MKSLDQINAIQHDPSPELPPLFTIDRPKEGVEVYIFSGVSVAIDTTSRNYKDLPEIHFGEYNAETHEGKHDQPLNPKAGTNMAYVAECIRHVVEATGLHQFWFDPYGGDVSEENKDRRENARLRLFKRILPSITPAPSGHGYILTV